MSDGDEIKRRTNRECGPGISEFLVPNLESRPHVTHHHRILPQLRDRLTLLMSIKMPLVIMSGTTVGSLCFLYGNKVAKRNCALKFSLTVCWTLAASSVGFESLFMNNPVSFWGIECPLTSMATSQGHGLTWNSLPREFFFSHMGLETAQKARSHSS